MSEIERIGGGELEQEAHAIERLFNGAIPSYSPKLEWVGMSHERDRDQQRFVFEARSYISRDGLEVLRDAGRAVRYIEAYEFEGEVSVHINLDVTGDIPTTDSDQPRTDGGVDADTLAHRKHSLSSTDPATRRRCPHCDSLQVKTTTRGTDHPATADPVYQCEYCGVEFGAGVRREGVDSDV